LGIGDVRAWQKSMEALGIQSQDGELLLLLWTAIEHFRARFDQPQTSIGAKKTKCSQAEQRTGVGGTGKAGMVWRSCGEDELSEQRSMDHMDWMGLAMWSAVGDLSAPSYGKRKPMTTKAEKTQRRAHAWRIYALFIADGACLAASCIAPHLRLAVEQRLGRPHRGTFDEVSQACKSQLVQIIAAMPKEL
jgi:hypothetical protein